MTPFFILGCPRSGTTLLQVLLNRHPEIVIPPELKLFFSCYNHTFRTRRATLDRINADLGISIPSSFATGNVSVKDIYLETYNQYCRRLGRVGVRCFGDKTPEHVFRIEYIRRVYPSARLIGVLRDPRDVVSSLLRVPWIHCNTSSASQLWKQSHVRLSIEAKRCPELFCWVRYEELIQNPLDTLEKILNFMQLSTQHLERLLTCSSSLDGLAFPVHERLWKANACQPLLSHRVQAWRRLEGTQSQAVEQIIGNEIWLAGYDLEDRKQQQNNNGLLAKHWQFLSLMYTMIGMPISVWIGELRYRMFRVFGAI